MSFRRKFELNFKFSKNIKYNFFPRPHFTTTDTIINDELTENFKN